MSAENIFIFMWKLGSKKWMHHLEKETAFELAIDVYYSLSVPNDYSSIQADLGNFCQVLPHDWPWCSSTLISPLWPCLSFHSWGCRNFSHLIISRFLSLLDLLKTANHFVNHLFPKPSSRVSFQCAICSLTGTVIKQLLLWSSL